MSQLFYNEKFENEKSHLNKSEKQVLNLEKAEMELI
jgi:hypothetical protein